MAEELTLSVDHVTGEYTRLTRFLPVASTAAFGGKIHPYPEEVFIVSGRLYDQAFDLWLGAGHYASRPPRRRCCSRDIEQHHEAIRVEEMRSLCVTPL